MAHYLISPYCLFRFLRVWLATPSFFFPVLSLSAKKSFLSFLPSYWQDSFLLYQITVIYLYSEWIPHKTSNFLCVYHSNSVRLESVSNSECPSQMDKVQEWKRAEAFSSVWKHGKEMKISSAHGRCLSQLDQSERRLFQCWVSQPPSFQWENSAKSNL